MTLPVFYSPAYCAAAHAFDTTRKAAWVAEKISDLPGVDVLDPAAYTNVAYVESLLNLVHDSEYITALETGEPRHLAESQGFMWDPGLYTGVTASTSGVIAAVDAAIGNSRQFSGSLSSGLHHAKYATGDGFCSVNGLIVAAAHAVQTYQMGVTILDVDAHAGGGTDNLLRVHAQTAVGLDAVTHLDLTTKLFDSYSHLAPRMNDINIEDPFLDDDGYLSTLERLLEHLPTGENNLVLYNAGMDPHPEISSDALVMREHLVVDALQTNGVAGVFVLAGGYTHTLAPEALASLHATTVAAFATASR
jgi:acetoin utilization deacetylase AcuC-like enzyme